MKFVEYLVTLLPAPLRPYGKAVAALLIAGGAVAATLAGAPTWVPLVVAVLNAPVVLAVPNIDPYAAEHAAE